MERRGPGLAKCGEVEDAPEHVVAGGKVLASSWCHDCHAGTCECLLAMAARARKVGPGAIVQGPLGRDLIKRCAA